MDLNKMRKYISVLGFGGLLLGSSSHAIDQLPQLISKQASNNIRFISQDGKFTYYQRQSGGLFLSTNYKVNEVLKGTPGGQYEILGSPARKKLLLSVNENFHKYFSLRQEAKLYSLKFGETTPSLLGKGQNPRLHVNDLWASYYSANRAQLVFTNLQSSLLKFTLNLSNKVNPYFIPEVVMIDEDRVLYTDLNSEGIPGIIDFKRGSGTLTPFLKVNSPLQKLELCLGENDLFVGQFGLSRSQLGSSITRYPRSNLIPQEGKVIYQSEKDDLGHMICDFSKEKIFFIQNKSQKGSKEYFEAVSLNVADGEIKTLSSLQFPTQIINMDGTLLIAFNGKTLILEGNNDLVKDSLPKKAEPLPEATDAQTEKKSE